MKLLWKNRSASQKKDGLWKSVTSGKTLKNQSQEKPAIHHPFNQLIDIAFNQSDKLLKENEKKGEGKKKLKKQLEDSPKKKHKQHAIKPVKTFIGSKLQKKLQNYMLFLTFVSSSLKASYTRIDKGKYTVYIGKGNNSKLVKKIFKSRHWWQITNDPKSTDINLVWTQWSKSQMFSKIKKSQMDDEVSEKVYSMKFLKKHHSNQYNNLIPKQYLQSPIETENDVKNFIKKNKAIMSSQVIFTHNHVFGHEEITDKKNLFHCFTKYCLQKSLNCFDFLPLTFHVSGTEEEYDEIERKENEMIEKNEKILWIVKPGEKSNRGQGISVFKKLSEVKEFIEKDKNVEKHPNRTHIIQKYIFPALFHRRKFDIRCFVLLIANPHLHAFFYSEGYLRTSCKQFKQKKYDDKLIHLTNDAIQKKATDYGKFEKGNKISFEEYQAYLDLFEKKKQINFKESILPKLKLFAARSIAASSNTLNHIKKQYSFEILGYDFMLDQEYRPWLIEVNTNPCLETGCPLLDIMIPNMLNNALKIGVDPVFKPPKISQWPLQSIFTFPNEILDSNKFQHIYSGK